MTISMNTTKITIEQIDNFLKGTESLTIEVGVTIEEKYQWIKTILTQTRYQLVTSRREKSLVRKFLVRCSGYSKSHVDHLIAEFKQGGALKRKPRDCGTEFQTFYTKEDIVLLAETSEAYFHQNGKAIKEVLHDMYHLYGDNRFERLSRLSVSRLYDLRKTTIYQNTVLTYQKTKPTAVNIGERKKPYPEGKPGYLRVDSVHQGDKDKEKGVYHVHLVDEVTQFDVQLATEGISEHFLLPILEEALSLFPFLILNFHSDNGSEYINRVVAGLLEKLRIGQTKSRSRRTNDNALVEGKNAATTRPIFGRVHIPKRYANDINDFNREQLLPFLNYHRKCAFPSEVIDLQGKITKVYKEFVTPVEKLLSLPKVESYLREGVSVADLRRTMTATSHLEAAQQMQKARTKLFKNFTK
jgi:hypothetical protein